MYYYALIQIALLSIILLSGIVSLFIFRAGKN